MKFSISKVQVELSFPVIAVFALVTVFDSTGSLFCCYLAAVIHEMGHLFTMCLCDSKPNRIKFGLFDIQILDKKRSLRSVKKDLLIVFAGIGANVCMCFFSLALYLLLHWKLILIFFGVNLFTALFNALPVCTLDGGQGLFLLLSQKFSREKSEKIIDICTILLIFPTAVLGFLLLFYSKYNFSLLFISMYLVSALIMKKSKFY